MEIPPIMGRIHLLLLAGLLPVSLGAATGDSTLAARLMALPRLTAQGLRTSVTHPQLHRHWLMIGLGVAAALPQDAQLQERAVAEGLLPDGLAELGDDWGDPGAVLTILPAIYLVEKLRRTPPGELSRRLTFAATSLAAVGLTTVVLKEVVRRPRPDDTNHRSFPSGHTSAAFGVAEIVRTLYGRRNAAVFYALATLTGISRIHDNRHYLSDVIAGAGLGMGMVRGFALAQGRTVRLTVTRLRLTPGSAELAIQFGAAAHRFKPVIR